MTRLAIILVIHVHESTGELNFLYDADLRSGTINLSRLTSAADNGYCNGNRNSPYRKPLKIEGYNIFSILFLQIN